MSRLSLSRKVSSDELEDASKILVGTQLSGILTSSVRFESPFRLPLHVTSQRQLLNFVIVRLEKQYPTLLTTSLELTLLYPTESYKDGLVLMTVLLLFMYTEIMSASVGRLGSFDFSGRCTCCSAFDFKFLHRCYIFL
jgi:hypothetical protein